MSYYTLHPDGRYYASGWDESKHPRRDDGKFGKGSGESFKKTLMSGGRSKSAGTKTPSYVSNVTDKGTFGKGVYLTTEESVASTYGPHVHEYDVDLKDPMYLEGDKKDAAERAAKNLGVKSKPEWDGFAQKSDDFAFEFTEMAQKAGHDGVVYTFPDGSQEVVVFGDVEPSKGQS